MLNDETMIIRTKAEDAALAKKRKRVLGIPVVIAAPLGALLAVGGAAVAAMLLDSNEVSAKADAGVATKLVLSDAKFNRPLFPGMTTDLSVKVANPNPFPATVSSLVISGKSTTTCNPAQLSGSVEVGTLSGDTLKLAKPVEVAANGDATVTLKDAVKLSKDATAGCEIVAVFKVTGSGAGN